jgi:hypothetical protein
VTSDPRHMVTSAIVICALCIMLPCAARAQQQLSSRDTTEVLRVTLEQYRPGDGPIRVVAATLQCVEEDAWGPLGPVRGTSCRSPATDSALIPFVRRHNAQLYEARPQAADVSKMPTGCFVEVSGFGGRGGKTRIVIVMTCPSRSAVVGGFLHQLTYEVTRVGSGWRVEQIASLIT